MPMLARKIQTSAHGVGPLFHRIYRVKFTASFPRALEAMRALQADPDHFSPQFLATFHKKQGEPGLLAVGDEFDVRLKAPFAAPVRVVEVGEHFFELATLEGHLECGKILFRVAPLGDRGSVFEIESTARSKDRVVDLLYNRWPIARFAQQQMWERFCESFAVSALLREEGESGEYESVEVITERRDEETCEWRRI